VQRNKEETPAVRVSVAGAPPLYIDCAGFSPEYGRARGRSVFQAAFPCQVNVTNWRNAPFICAEEFATIGSGNA
jgi:hypothetical protein